MIKLHVFLSYHNNNTSCFCVWFTYNPAGLRPLKIRFTSHRQSMFFHETNSFAVPSSIHVQFSLFCFWFASEGDDCLCDWWKSHIRFIWYIWETRKFANEMWGEKCVVMFFLFISSRGVSVLFYIIWGFQWESHVCGRVFWWREEWKCFNQQKEGFMRKFHAYSLFFFWIKICWLIFDFSHSE